MTHKDALDKLKQIVIEQEGCPLPQYVNLPDCVGCNSNPDDCVIAALLETADQAVADIEELARSKRVLLDIFLKPKPAPEPPETLPIEHDGGEA